ncbi:MAG: hydrolase [Gemmatales bacterium]|nr:MAG: hydrolase [Gemmatales bacterium]
MLQAFKKLQYGARVLLSRSGGHPETVHVAGKEIVVKHGGDGLPFVYLHSTLDESTMWFPFFQRWSQEFRVLVPTHPGFGKSTGFEDIDSIEDLAFHYLELFDALGLEEVILGGVSLGGWIAAEFAVRWPERVRKLWLCGAPGLWVDDVPLGDLFRVMHHTQQLRELLFFDPDSYMSRMILSDKPSDDRLIAAYQSMTVLARLVWERPYDPKLSRRLHRVRCPVLLLWGDHDRVVPPAYGEAYRRLLPQSELKLLANCGHLPMFEKEDEFVQVIADFARG